MNTIGVDLGATNLRAALVRGEEVLGFKSEPTERSRGPEGLTDQVIRMTKNLRKEYPCVSLEAIGIGSVGPLDLSSGTILNPPNLSIGNIPIVACLSTAHGVPAFLINDCNAAVLAEATYGEGIAKRNLVYVTISTGLGAGAIVDGHLLIGKDGNAVEIGHTTIDAKGLMTCSCGCRGHWEAYCSGESIPRYAKKLLKRLSSEELSSSLIADWCGIDSTELTSKQIFDAAERQDRLAMRVIQEVGRLNAVGFANIISLFDPELITVGGSVALNHPKLVLDPIISNVRGHTINRLPDIRLTKLGENIVVFGAAAYAASKLHGLL